MSLQARYTILRKIADGGTAEIFLANQRGDHGFEKLVVLKRIFPAFYADPEFRGMLVNEAHIAMSLNHSNIVQVLDLGEDEGQYILALELVDGWTLDAVIRRVRAARSTMPPALALHVIGEVCRALSYAHAKTDAEGKPLGIVHRDISPHNVLLSEQGEVKLTDFGIATAQNQREPGGEKVIKGKIAYMSPEQASGDPMDARSDLFSVGTMLYVMVCGRYPFDAATDLELLLLVKSGQFVPPETARPGLHPEVTRLLQRMMAKNLADRYQSADDILADVEQVMRSAFRSVGQTELKRWLQDLSIRDGVPALTKAPPAVVTSHAGRVLGPGTGPRPDPAAPTTTRATATSPHRAPPPVPPGARAVSSSVRPPPPRAAFTAGRKSGVPTRPVPTLGPTEVTSVGMEAAPEPLENVPLLDDAALDLEPDPEPPRPDADERTQTDPPVAEPVFEPVLEPVFEPVLEKRPEPPRGPPGPSSPSLVALSSGATVPPPSTVVPPPPTAASPLDAVPPPPVTAEILAAVGSGRIPGGFGSGRVATAPSRAGAQEPSAFPGSINEPPRPSRSRLGLVLGLGLVSAVAVFASVKTCGSHRQEEVAPGSREKAAAAPAATPDGRSAGAEMRAPATAAPAIATVTGTEGGASPSEAGASAAVSVPPADAAVAGEADNHPAGAAVAIQDKSGKTGALGSADGALIGSGTTVSEPTRVDGGDVVRAAVPAPSAAPPVAAPTPAAPAAAPTPTPAPEVAEAPMAAAPSRTAPPTGSSPPDPAAPRGDGSGDPTADTAAQGQKVMVLLKSVPAGARVTTAHHDYGTTPVSIRLKSGNAYAFMFNYDGYKPTKQRLEVTTDPDQEVTVTLKKGAGGPAGTTTATPEAPPPPPPPAAPPGSKSADPSWWQQMFKKR